MIIEHLSIEIATVEGPYSVDVPFRKGLSIFRVDNTHGKSTCMNGIAYGLGMERALGPMGNRLPFPPAVTKRLLDKNGKEQDVLASRIFIQIKNSKGRVSTIERSIVGSDDQTVVLIYPCEYSNIENVKPKPYFLHSKGDSDHPMGFYSWLAEFNQWDLPKVQKYDGEPCLLYPSVFFPAYFIEQKRGWSAPLNNIPTIFGIREPKKRAIEFILGLAPNRLQEKKVQISRKLEGILAEWEKLNYLLKQIAMEAGGTPSGQMEKPKKGFDPYKIDIIVETPARDISIQFAIDGLSKELDILRKKISSFDAEGTYSDEELQKINEATEKLSLARSSIIDLSNEEELLKAEQNDLIKRKKSLDEQLIKYQDICKITSKVPEFQPENIDLDSCPTCGQDISDFLGEKKPESQLMSFAESLGFIKNQLKVVDGILEGNSTRIIRVEGSISRKKEEHSKISAEISELNGAMERPNKEIERQLVRDIYDTELRINKYSESIDKLVSLRSQYSEIHDKYQNAIKERSGLSKARGDNDDKEKILFLQDALRVLLNKFSFSSFPANEIEISSDSYLPSREGFDINFDVSASDNIRIVWAYTIALMLTSRRFNGNHPGFVVFDEPRQQDANSASFSMLISEAAKACGDQSQIIVATSEDENSLSNALGDTPHFLENREPEDGKLIQKREIS